MKRLRRKAVAATSCHVRKFASQRCWKGVDTDWEIVYNCSIRSLAIEFVMHRKQIWVARLVVEPEPTGDCVAVLTSPVGAGDSFIVPSHCRGMRADKFQNFSALRDVLGTLARADKMRKCVSARWPSVGMVGWLFINGDGCRRESPPTWGHGGWKPRYVAPHTCPEVQQNC